jgi:hypothetical protein
MTNVHRVLVVKRDSGVPLGTSTHTGLVNIKLDVKEMLYELYTGRKLDSR